ncbi:MAG TPA: CpaF family protein [Tepidisphaeraceae bacterium]|jgi:pilus assembly protein CpaF|nr:CpaF family protein [Tepidisphaeraceae bacterium]
MPDAITDTSTSQGATQQSDQSRKTRRRLVEQFSKQAQTTGDAARDATTRRVIEEELPRALRGEDAALPDAVREEMLRDVINDLFGFGPIQPLLDDPTVTEVMVNRADRVYVERNGKPARTTITFDDDAHVQRIIDRIMQPLGKHLDGNNPLVDARLPDGSRVNVVIPPVAIGGPCITIRKFSRKRLVMEDLVKFGSLTQSVADFLKSCVQARLNIVVCGGTGSGKTTLLNVLSSCIGEDERIVTIEDAAELKLNQDHVITLEAKRAGSDTGAEVTIRELVRNALRMRPERIVVGECRGAEALDMLQAMNTGHDGSLTTLHANSPRDAISRIETMALMAGIDFPVRVIREQMGSAIHLLVHQARMRDGSRKVTHVTEIAGMEGDKVLMQELFRFKEIPTAAGAEVKGSLMPMGLRPQFMNRFEAAGLVVKPETFAPGAVANQAKYRNAAA